MDNTEPKGAQGNEPDDIRDFPEDDPIAHAERDVARTIGKVDALLENFSQCKCPVCTQVCESVRDICQVPVKGLWERLDEIAAMEDDQAMFLYLGSLMTACSHARATCREMTAVAYAAHEAYNVVETKTTIAVAKTTAKALIGGNPEVLVGVVPPEAIPNMGGGNGGSHGPN
jgi:hypothetical protein